MAKNEHKSAKVKDVPMEGSGEESEEETLGLLERPIEIIETRRERKKVERLLLSNDDKAKKKEGLDYSKGKGVKLGDIDIVRYEINRSLSAELKPLHKLLYKQFGKTSTIKKNIYAFCGFPFEKDSKEYGDLDWQMEKFAKMGLLRLCEIFGLSLKGNRDELKAKVLEFLMKPYQTDKKVPGKVQPPSSKKSRKRKSKSSDEKPKKKKKVAENDKEDDDGSDDEEDVDEKEEENIEREKKKKKEAVKKETKAKPKKATVIKLPTPSKKKKVKEEKVKEQEEKVKVKEEKMKEKEEKVKEKEEKVKKKKVSPKAKKVESDSEEDEPLSKIPKGPSDEEIEKVVEELLDGADLETVTMKMICKQVFDKFPNHDLTERKSFIKETVKQIIS